MGTKLVRDSARVRRSPPEYPPGPLSLYTPLPKITRNSHYVPQATLRRWSDDGVHVYAYRLLVSHSNVPEWEPRAIRGLTRQPDLYTLFSGGKEEDEFETFITRGFEEPGQEAIEKLLVRSSMKPADWHRIARFAVAQDLRTPLNFLESMARFKKNIDEALEKTVRNYEARGEIAAAEDTAAEERPAVNYLRDTLRVSIDRPSGPGGQAAVRAEVSSGRSVWMATMRHFLENRSGIVCKHHWRTAKPADGEEWPLTDHPVLRLNYNGPEQYDFGGGWNSNGSEFIMPVSPRLAVYTQIGTRGSGPFTFSLEQTRMVQRLLVERAFRWVLAPRPLPWVAAVRPRVVDAEIFSTEQEVWKRWNPEQAEAEARFVDEGTASKP